MDEFNSMIDQAGLINGGYSGSKITSSNNRTGSARILERLGRTFYNSTWLSLSITTVMHLNRTNSDHAPILVSCSTSSNNGSSFRFPKVWIRHANFLQSLGRTNFGKANSPILKEIAVIKKTQGVE